MVSDGKTGAGPGDGLTVRPAAHFFVGRVAPFPYLETVGRNHACQPILSPISGLPMSFPADLADILPLKNGTQTVRFVKLPGRSMNVEIIRAENGTYGLWIYNVDRRGRKKKLQGFDNLSDETAVSGKWNEFLQKFPALAKQ